MSSELDLCCRIYSPANNQRQAHSRYIFHIYRLFLAYFVFASSDLI
jgi:hypothetical protein